MRSDLWIRFILLHLASLWPMSVSAQSAGTVPEQGRFNVTPAHQSEFGLHLGHAFVSGDIAFQPGFGAGIHFRRALDYIFSFRFDANYAYLRGQRNNGTEKFTTNAVSTTLHGIVTVNNLHWNEPNRKTNLYLFAGAGLHYFSADFDATSGGKSQDVENAYSPVFDLGAGVSFRLNERINIGLDQKFSMLFSKYADKIDASQNIGFRDMTSYTSIRLNYNFGRKDKSEPLYWINPMTLILNDLADVKQKQLDYQDTDADGVADVFDQEPNTPPGAPVDTKGVTLDSDEDGVPDYLDAEKYSPPGFNVDEQGRALKPTYLSKEEFEELLRRQIDTKDPEQITTTFLPLIHFDINSARIRAVDAGHLESVAKILKGTPNLRLRVIGHTDLVGSEPYNNILSYERAKSVIDYLVDKHNVERSNLVLQWRGEDSALVTQQGSSLMNRRVEFSIATERDTDMQPPEVPEELKNNKDGY